MATVQDARKEDLISRLPFDVKERILECLPTRDVARTAMLSTHWNHVWLRHGRLTFDSDFWERYKGDKTTSGIDIINNILSLRAEPVKKFTLEINRWDLMPQHRSDIDRWCLFVSKKGVAELSISVSEKYYQYNYMLHRYKLPVYIFSCCTIKKLKLYGFPFGIPVNAGCIFPGVTSLAFEKVLFGSEVNGIVFSFPKLEKLAFRGCYLIKNFEISAPKLRRLSVFGFKNFEISPSEPRWFTVHLEAIKALSFSPDLVLATPLSKVALRLPIAINLQVIKLYDLSFACGKHFIFTMELLQKSPNLCKLEIVVGNKERWHDDKEAASRILEDPDSYVINQNLKMLNTVKIESFRGSELEILLVKALLSNSPVLEKIVIQEWVDMDPSMALNISQELLHCLRASPKAQLVFMKYNSEYSLVGPPKL